MVGDINDANKSHYHVSKCPLLSSSDHPSIAGRKLCADTRNWMTHLLFTDGSETEWDYYIVYRWLVEKEVEGGVTSRHIGFGRKM